MEYKTNYNIEDVIDGLLARKSGDANSSSGRVEYSQGALRVLVTVNYAIDALDMNRPDVLAELNKLIDQGDLTLGYTTLSLGNDVSVFPVFTKKSVHSLCRQWEHILTEYGLHVPCDDTCNDTSIPSPDLKNLDFSWRKNLLNFKNLSRADLSGANFSHSVIYYSIFKNTDFRGAIFEDTEFLRCQLDGAKFKRSDLEKVKMSKRQLAVIDICD